MEKLSKECPYCKGELEIERLRCSGCHVAIEGKIGIPRLARLSVDNREFIELFVRSSGSLKAVAEKLGISYPTVRNRLDRVIEALNQEEVNDLDERRKILDGIESGAISVDEAIQRLKEL
jgi:hypothetical protein